MLMLFPCIVCKQNVITEAIECSLCEQWVHRKCAKLSIKQIKYLGATNINWYCEVCKDVFPFHSLEEDEFIYINCNCDMLNVNISRIYDKCKSAEMLLFNLLSLSTVIFLRILTQIIMCTVT